MEPTIKLANNSSIPQIGLGLWQIKDESEFKIAFKSAIKAGYTHFDTAQAYNNEQILGQCIKEMKLKREDLFITTKIHIANFAPKKLHQSFEESLNKLRTDYVDLLLLHFPVTMMRKKAWLVLEDLMTSSLVKNIGVSNYTEKHLEEMKSYASIMPVINQVELHVFLQQPELIKYCNKNKIAIEAYSPLAHGALGDNQVIQKIADKYHKTYAQIMLRFLVEQNLVVIPKSVNPKRIEENIDIFDFNLDKEDMAELKKQDKNKRTCWSPVHVP
jgi:diketogulonate reductase-like aldo/keto reductase